MLSHPGTAGTSSSSGIIHLPLGCNDEEGWRFWNQSGIQSHVESEAARYVRCCVNIALAVSMETQECKSCHSVILSSGLKSPSGCNSGLMQYCICIYYYRQKKKKKKKRCHCPNLINMHWSLVLNMFLSHFFVLFFFRSLQIDILCQKQRCVGIRSNKLSVTGHNLCRTKLKLLWAHPVQ